MQSQILSFSPDHNQNPAETHLPRFPEYQTMTRHMADEAAKFMCCVKHPAILDVGADSNLLLNEIRRQMPGASFHGLASSSEMLEIFDRTGFAKLHLLAAHIKDFSFGKDKFDVVCANLSLQQIDDKRPVLKNIRRHMKPNSLFLLGEIAVDFHHSDERFLSSVLKRWTHAALHAQRYANDNAVRMELDSMKMVYERKGAYPETAPNWLKLLMNAGFLILDHTVIDNALGYHVFACTNM